MIPHFDTHLIQSKKKSALISTKIFRDINLRDSFFDSFKEDYAGFDRWFMRKSNEAVHVILDQEKVRSFLYLKIEDKYENYSDISPVFSPKRRLKIGTLKVTLPGLNIGNSFMNYICDYAHLNRVEEIYVTIFDKREEQERLMNLLMRWGFIVHGEKITKSGKELVYVKELVFNSAHSRNINEGIIVN